MANGRCRMHGGRSLAGVAHPNYKTGRYSSYVPQRLLPGFARQMRDPELLQQREEIALVDAFVFDALKAMGEADSRTLWLELRKLWQGLEEARRGGDLRNAAAKIAAIGELIRLGAHEYEQQDYVLDLMERKRRIVESQSKREVQERHAISYEDAAAMFRSIAEAVRYVVKDRDQLAEIQRRFSEITGSVYDSSEN
jgi:hypothetical protein